jgi:hypothetical protein
MTPKYYSLRHKLCPVDDHKPALAPGEQVPCFVSNLPFMIQLTAIAARHKSLDDNLLPYPDRALVLHVQVRRNGVLGMKACRLAHHFIQQQRDDSAVHKSRPALILFAKLKSADDPLACIILVERKLHAPHIRAAASEAPVIRLGIEPPLAP